MSLAVCEPWALNGVRGRAKCAIRGPLTEDSAAVVVVTNDEEEEDASAGGGSAQSGTRLDRRRHAPAVADPTPCVWCVLEEWEEWEDFSAACLASSSKIEQPACAPQPSHIGLGIRRT
jgi:hypothetical protein